MYLYKMNPLLVPLDKNNLSDHFINFKELVKKDYNNLISTKEINSINKSEFLDIFDYEFYSKYLFFRDYLFNILDLNELKKLALLYEFSIKKYGNILPLKLQHKDARAKFLESFDKNQSYQHFKNLWNFLDQKEIIQEQSEIHNKWIETIKNEMYLISISYKHYLEKMTINP